MKRDVTDFFNTLYPDPPSADRRLVVWILEGRKKPPPEGAKPRRVHRSRRSYWMKDLDKAAARVLEMRNAWDVYFGVALQNPDQALAGESHRALPYVRGTKASAVLLPALFADLDVATDGHREKHRPPTGEDALTLLDAVPRPPSILVRSGHGYHVYWLLNPPLELDCEAARGRATDLLARLQGALARRAGERGWKVDQMADLARVLRVPATLNHKLGEVAPVVLHELHRDRLYSPADFDDLPPAPGRRPEPAESSRKTGAAAAGGEQSQPRAGGSGRGRKNLDRGARSDAGLVRAGCAFFESCIVGAADLDYYRWLAMLTLAVRCDSHEGSSDELAHRYSRPYEGYTVAETDEKIRQARKLGPYTCARIAREFSQPVDHCSSCAHFELGSSPVTLGRRMMLAGLRRKFEQEKAAPPAVEVEVTPREDEVNDRVLTALAERETNLFERAGVLVQMVPSLAVERDRDDPAPLAQPVQEARLRELLARHCDFHKHSLDKGGQPVRRPVHPPQWCVRALLHRGEWRSLKRLRGVVEGPVLRPDGGVLQEPGYDPASGLYYAPYEEVATVVDAPRDHHLADALAAVDEAVCDFPFATGDHHAAWLSALLTPLARYAFRGPSPLNLIDANVRGAGKSLLADVCATILTGRPAERMSYTRDDDELRKSITAMAIEGTPLALIDNVRGNFGSATLDRALTATTWRDRLLGGNVQMVSTLRMVWFATGNNVSLQGDTPRRCLHLRLESPEERPEERSGFRHPRLLRWIAGERQRLLPAAVTLLRGYVAAGLPDMGLSSWGSYEGWSDLVRSTVVWLGLPDPANTRGGLEEGSDSEGGVLGSLLDGLEEVLTALGGEAPALAMLAELRAQPDGYRTLRTALGELFPRLQAGDLPTSAKLAYKLRSLRGRVIEGRSIRPAGRKTGGTLWRVERSPDSGSEG